MHSSLSHSLALAKRFRVLLALILVVVVFHLSFVHYHHATPSLKSQTIDDIRGHSEVRYPTGYNYTEPPVKAAIVILARNSNLHDLRAAITQFHDRFNKHYHYPYVFLNNVPFTDEFKDTIIWSTKTKTSFGVIPHEHWTVPKWIDRRKMRKGMRHLASKNVIHSDNINYRQMCRYHAGFIHKHPLLQEYDYYWRMEHDVQYTCDIDYDPFAYMKTNDIKYGFTITLHEFDETVKTLWQSTQQFIIENPDLIHPHNTVDWLTSDRGSSYNLCHFWTNFEIIDMSLLRSKAYEKFFDFMDHQGGIFYERWGDAPLRSLAVTMFLPKQQVHWFEDIGYVHSTFQNCPDQPEMQRKCHCDPERSIHTNAFSCTLQWENLPPF
ncbi:hypothetical protein H4R35_004608 [Dimargaris xerosporica]|nr:hypothetical protein H4R35_004608 [Dimargaris xerosporica]